MSPAKKKSVRKPVKRATRAPRKASIKPAAPKRLSVDFRDLNVVWYNVTDWERAKKFYRDTLGLPVIGEMDSAGWAEYGHPNQTHIAINLWRGPDPMPPTHGGGTVVLGCDDARALAAKLRGKGVKCDEPQEIPGMVLLIRFYDPEGNELQMTQSLMK
jgi:predicted enzyme related to lactoylglutathione lyase